MDCSKCRNPADPAVPLTTNIRSIPATIEAFRRISLIRRRNLFLTCALPILLLIVNPTRYKDRLFGAWYSFKRLFFSLLPCSRTDWNSLVFFSIAMRLHMVSNKRKLWYVDSYGESHPSFESTTLNHSSPTSGTHAGSKTVDTLSSSFFWLPGAFGHCFFLGGEYTLARIGVSIKSFWIQQNYG